MFMHGGENLALSRPEKRRGKGADMRVSGHAHLQTVHTRYIQKQEYWEKKASKIITF
jgi:hypothetical protein